MLLFGFCLVLLIHHHLLCLLRLQDHLFYLGVGVCCLGLPCIFLFDCLQVGCFIQCFGNSIHKAFAYFSVASATVFIDLLYSHLLFLFILCTLLLAGFVLLVLWGTSNHSGTHSSTSLIGVILFLEYGCTTLARLLPQVYLYVYRWCNEFF